MVPCRTLAGLLHEYGITHIDFFSLDVEGQEAAVLSTINFDKVKIDVLIVETNRLGFDSEEQAKAKNDMVHKILTAGGLIKVIHCSFINVSLQQ